MPADPTQALIDAPEPAERIHLEPMLPLGGLPFTPKSRCPHYCKKCSGSGVVGIDPETNDPIECPVCGGTGDSWPDDPFVCIICHRSGKDGRRAVPFGVEPPGETVEAA